MKMNRIERLLAVVVMLAGSLQAAVFLDIEGIRESTVVEGTFLNLDASPPSSTSEDLVPAGTFSVPMDGGETFTITFTAVNDWDLETATSTDDVNAYIAGLTYTNFNGNNAGWGVSGGSDKDLDNAGEAFVITFDLSGLSAEHQDIFWIKSTGGEKIDPGELYHYAAIDVSKNAVSAAGEGLDVEEESILDDIAIGDGDQFVFGHDAGVFRIAGLTVDVAEPVMESTVSLNPSDELSMALAAPSSTSNATFDLSYSYGVDSNDVEISSVVVSDQTHPGAFSCLNTNFPVLMTDPAPSNETFTIEFDNSVAGLTADGETATGTVVVTWNEVGDTIPYTEEVPVTLLYSVAESTLLIEPFAPNRLGTASPVMAMSIVAPALTANRDMKASYIADAWAPTNMVITRVEFSNTTHAGFSSPDTFPMTLAYPPPTNAAFNIAFDGSSAGLAEGESATGNVVVAWSALGSSVTNQTIYPVMATSVVLEPTTGTIVERGTNMPVEHIVLKAEPALTQSPDIQRVNEFDGGYSKVGQEIQVTELDGDETAVGSLFLKVANDFDFTHSSGANQLQIWFGRIVSGTGVVVEDLATETFDCAGRVFSAGSFLQFNFSDPINLDPAYLAAGESYAFELWWTTDDPENFIDFRRGTEDTFDGGLKIFEDSSASDTTFPVLLESPNDNRVFVFALGEVPSITEISDIQVGLAGEDVVLSWQGIAGASYAVEYNADLVHGVWSNLVGGVSGTDVISVTNHTTEPHMFYRTILE